MHPPPKGGRSVGSQTLGQKIRDLRRRLKMTQSDLAGTEFTKSFISQVEKGQTSPSLRSLQIIAARLNQPVSYFLDEPDPMTPQSQELLSAIETANHLHASGFLSDAIPAYQRALSLAAPTDHVTKGNLSFRLGHIYLKLLQYEKAIDAFRSAAEEYQKTTIDEFYVRTLNNLGTAHYYLRQYHEARRWFEEALSHLDRLAVPNAQLRLLIFTNLGNVLSKLSLYDEAIEVVEKALALSKSEGDYYKYGELCQIAGVVYDAIGDDEEALRHTERAVSFYEAVGNRALRLASSINKAIHLRKLGRLSEAKQVALAVIDEAREADLVQERARALAELGAVLALEGDHQGALMRVKEALRLAPVHPDLPEWTALVAACAKHTALPPDLLQRLDKLAERWEGDARGKAELHSSLGELHRLAGSTEKANEHLSKSVEYFRKV